MIEQIKKADRAILSLAHQAWFRKLVLMVVACVAMSLATSMISTLHAGLVHEAERLILPSARGAADALRDVSVAFSNEHNWRQAVNYHHVLSALLILGIMLQSVLAGMHINEKLRGHLQKHPVARKSVVIAATLLIAVGGLPEAGDLLAGLPWSLPEGLMMT